MSAPTPPSREGLTAEQLEQLLIGDWLTVGPLRLNQDLADEELRGAVVLENARRFLRAALEPGGLPATAEGRLNRGALELLLDRMQWGSAEYAEWVREKFGGDLREADVRPLAITRVLLERLQLIERRGGVFHATPSAIPLLRPEMAGRFVALLFRGYFRDFDHSLTDVEDPAPEIHQHAAYSLWVVAQTCDTWRDTRELLPRLLPAGVAAAETARLERLQEASHSARPPGPLVATPQVLLLLRFLEILPDYGIMRSEGEDHGTRYPSYLKTALFDQFITFDFGIDPPPRLDWDEPPRPLRLVR
ncbi:MAG: hypothetical protein ACREMW_05360 [Gemmatimonadales bacterium]